MAQIDSVSAAPSEGKLLDLLRGFSSSELNRLRAYIASSYLSNQDLLLQIFDTVVPLVNKDGSKATRGQQLFKLLLKMGQYGTAPYRTLFADLLKLSQAFIANKQYNEKPQKVVTDALKAVNAKRLNKLFDINLSLAERLQSSVSGRSAAHHLRAFVRDTEQEFHTSLALAHAENTAPSEIIHQLDTFTIINRLRYACATKHYKVPQSTPAEDPLFETILVLAQGDFHKNDKVIVVYSTIYEMLLDTEESASFLQLKKLLKTHQGELPEIILRDAYAFAINYCVARVNRGHWAYLKEVYELYQIALDRNFLYDQEELSPWDISNIIALGMQIRDINWSDKLIEVYKERAPNATKMNVVNYNAAKMYFFSGRYRDVLKILLDVKIDEPMYLLGAHSLLIKTYYELGELDAMNDRVATFRTLLKRRKSISAEDKKSYLELLEKINEIVKATTKKRRKEILSRLKENTTIAERDWLLEVCARENNLATN